MMGALFHKYKTLLEINIEKKEDNDNEIKEKIRLLGENNPQGKILSYRTCKKWQGLVEFLHKEGHQILLKIILETCNYNEYVIR